MAATGSNDINRDKVKYSESSLQSSPNGNIQASSANVPDHFNHKHKSINDSGKSSNQRDERHSQCLESTTRQVSNRDEQQRCDAGSNVQYFRGDAIKGRRKRKFSNRSKTGCLTCRKRKKKCDEARPVCKTCDRGSFKCDGYSTARTSVSVNKADTLYHTVKPTLVNTSQYPPPQNPPPVSASAPPQPYPSQATPSLPKDLSIPHQPFTPLHRQILNSSPRHHRASDFNCLRTSVEDDERSRMLRYSLYRHLDTALVDERQRCGQALARYNAAYNIDSGSAEARTLLSEVFNPSRNTTCHLAKIGNSGLGRAVHIEAPFTCTYGYNITVKDNCFIGGGTKIDDAAHVEIGARAWIGPHVTILTSLCVPDLVDREGSRSFRTAQTVYIGSDVVIGPGAVIYPGLRLERGVIVEPSAIVKENCEENRTVLACGGQRERGFDRL